MPALNSLETSEKWPLLFVVSLFWVFFHLYNAPSTVGNCGGMCVDVAGGVMLTSKCAAAGAMHLGAHICCVKGQVPGGDARGCERAVPPLL